MYRSTGIRAVTIALIIGGADARATEGGGGTVEAVALPSAAACTFKANPWWDPLRLELASGVPYAEVKGVDAIEVTVPIAAAPAPVGVKVKKGRFTLEGLVPAGAVPLHPSRAFIMGELFVPTPSAPFRWTDAAPGEVGIEVSLPAATVKALGDIDRSLRARRRCADLALRSAFDPFEAVGGHGLDRVVRFKAASPVPISLTPGGAPLEALTPTRAMSESLTVIDRRPGWSRIGLFLGDFVLFGWVPAAALRPPPKGSSDIGDAFGAGGLGLSGVGEPKLKAPISCNHDVPLVAEAGRQRRVVGTIGAGIAMEMLPGDAAYAAVRFDGLDPVKGAQFLVQRADVKNCAAHAP